MSLIRIAATVASSFDWSRVTGWAAGRDPEEFGWTVDGRTFSAYDLMEAAERGWDGVKLFFPDELADEAMAAGYSPDEMDVFMADRSDRFATADADPRDGSEF